MPENTDAKHKVPGIDEVKACVGNDRENSILAGISVVRMLVKMVSAEVQRMIDLDVFLGEDFAVFNDLQLTYVIADDPVVA